jgi:hypothetical protein
VNDSISVGTVVRATCQIIEKITNIMKQIKNLTVACIFLIAQYNRADAREQKTNQSQKKVIFQLGMGTGLDHGGIGIKWEVVPFPYLGIFAGWGYNVEAFGVNGGLSIKTLPFKRACPTLQAMYGYNAVIVIHGEPKYDKTYYGPSVGAGLDLRVGKNINKLFFGIYHPFRSEKFHKDLDKLKADPSIRLNNKLLPVTFSFGFSFGL